MRFSLPRLILPLLAGALSLVSTPTEACSIPVFRYALERFQADPYRAVVFHRGPLTPQEKELADALKALTEGQGAQANAEVEFVDLAAATDAARKPEWTPPEGTALPWLVLTYPDGPLSSPAWAGPFKADALRGLFDSPARREIAARLLKKGESAVFVLLESGQKASPSRRSASRGTIRPRNCSCRCS
ncbi:MAG: hypothetical protein NTW87_21800 [Planctomycetota bacterium]|nr:hypothetical protein [Planctomycetota bacterium]